VSDHWSTLAGLLAVYAVVLPVGTAPLLVSERVRALLCWPSDRWWANYLLVWTVLIPLQMVGYGVAVLFEDRVAALLGRGDPGLYGLAAANFGVPTICVLVGVLLLRRGDRMPESAYDVLPLVVTWYAAVALAAMVVYGILAAVGAVVT